MNKFTLLAFFIVFLVSSCEKTVTRKLKQGTYKGYYQKTENGQRFTTYVTIGLYDNMWTGNPDSGDFPKMGQGRYLFHGEDSIVFTNESKWPTGLENKHLLQGRFRFRFIKDSLVIERNLGPDFQDEYRLEKNY